VLAFSLRSIVLPASISISTYPFPFPPTN
jgi:hypothetical protein